MTLAGLAPNALVAAAVAGSAGGAETAVLATEQGACVLDWPAAVSEISRIERELSPRWVWWSKDTARHLVEAGIRPAKCWDLAAVHRLLFGDWRCEPGAIWARLRDLDVATIPTRAPVDLFSQLDTSGDPEDPIGADGHLRPEWVDGEWGDSNQRLVRWAGISLSLQREQQERLARLDDRPHAHRTALSESAAELLCAELEIDGLPFDRATAESIIAEFIGPRPRDAAAARAQLERRDGDVLRHLPPGAMFDLRSPEQVKSLLRRVGIEVPDTRAWRLEGLTDAHPIVAPLLAWRRAERILTTFGYDWIDSHVGPDDRLRGAWSGADGAAGRMTATAGLHNMPAELRPAIAAEPGRVFVRADLGQIEPRILAAVSGDPALAAATQDDDMYAPVARQLQVEREIAKVAVLGAMYGQTTGKGAQALARLEREYPTAMQYLRAADLAAQGSHDLRTFGGRLVRMNSTNANDVSERDARSRAAARGRYGRNAMVQGAAAEFFKTWAVLMRARVGHLGASIVLCLHDEVLLHVPEAAATATAELLESCLQEAAHRWVPSGRRGPAVRFVSDTSIISRWSEAKAAG